MNLKSQCSESDYKYLAPKLIANFKGPLLEDVQRMELNANDYRTKDGIEKLLAFLQKRINITDLNLEKEAFEDFSTRFADKKGKPTSSTKMTKRLPTGSSNEFLMRPYGKKRMSTAPTTDQNRSRPNLESSSTNSDYPNDYVDGSSWREQTFH